MNPLRLSYRRLLRLLKIFMKYRLDRLADLGLTSPFWLKFIRLPLLLKPPPSQNLGTDLVSALTELGPAFIKLGQLLSTRRDLLPERVADALATLQDQVGAFDTDLAMSLLEQALGAPIKDHFSHVNQTPIASASIAQVHSAQLLDGQAVVIKLKRPNIEQDVLADLAMLESIASLIERTFQASRRLHLFEVLRDYRAIILGELDFIQEADNAKKLREYWLPRGKLYVPKIHPQYTRENVIVMEQVFGIGIGNRHELIEANVDLERLANLGVEIFFTQVFIDNFFHADMHPGNILIDASDPKDPTYIALDCAIIGSLTRQDRNYLGRNLISFFNEDYRDIAEAHVESGWVPAYTDINAFERVIRDTCAPLFGKTMSDIAFGKLLVELFSAARQFNMEVQPQLVLLQKTLLNIEGIGRHLYGDLDLWQTAAPFMQTWRKDRLSPKRVVQDLLLLGPELLHELPDLPKNLLLASRRIEQLSKSQVTQSKALNTLENALTKQLARQRRRDGFMIMAFPLITGYALKLMDVTISIGMLILGLGIIGVGVFLVARSKETNND